jgi:hypothetical protein
VWKKPDMIEKISIFRGVIMSYEERKEKLGSFSGLERTFVLSSLY